MKTAKWSAVIVTGALLTTLAHAPAFAASRATNVFLNNLMPNVDFLDRSSRFAMTNAKSAKIKDFAHNEAREQTLAANALDEWIEADKKPMVATASSDGTELQTGRSVAIDGQPSQAADARLPMGQEDLDSIEGLTGAEFDSEYKLKQAVALKQIESDYQTYIATGDDPVLLGIANRELPKVHRRLAEIGKL